MTESVNAYKDAIKSLGRLLAEATAEIDRLNGVVEELERQNGRVRIKELEAKLDEARANLSEASKAWDGPETTDWLIGVRKEAAHQIARWGVSHDAGKESEDWFWLLGYLAGKALASAKTGDIEKARHHTISSGAALLNWHAALDGTATQFRPGTKA